MVSQMNTIRHNREHLRQTRVHRISLFEQAHKGVIVILRHARRQFTSFNKRHFNTID